MPCRSRGRGLVGHGGGCQIGGSVLVGALLPRLGEFSSKRGFASRIIAVRSIKNFEGVGRRSSFSRGAARNEKAV